MANPPQVAAPTRDPARYAPVFVLAPARSHSSVVTTMIGRHPQLYGFPELGLFRRATVGPLLYDPPGWKGQPARHRLAGLLRALAERHDGVQTEATVTEAYRWLRRRRAWSVADLYDHLLASVEPRIGLEKTPDNSGRAEHLQRLLDAYPRARFLHLTRHPVTTQMSMFESWSGKPYWDVPAEVFHHFCMGVWYFHNRRILELASVLPPERILRARSEDVLNSPLTELPRICRWLGIDAGETAVACMLHPDESPFAGLGPVGAMGGNDPKFLRDPTLRPARLPESLDVPGEWRVDPWLLTACVELAYQLGYTHSEAPGSS